METDGLEFLYHVHLPGVSQVSEDVLVQMPGVGICEGDDSAKERTEKIWPRLPVGRVPAVARLQDGANPGGDPGNHDHDDPQKEGAMEISPHEHQERQPVQRLSFALLGRE